MAQTQIFRGTARAIIDNASVGRQYVYHRTAVVTKRPNGEIVLDSGGWRTNTTKTAMNQASNQDRLGFTVYAKNHEWRVRVGDQDFLFNDGLTIRV